VVIPLLKFLSVSAHNLYKWLWAIKPDNSEQHAHDLLEAQSELLKVREQLKWVISEKGYPIC
jgi:transposase